VKPAHRIPVLLLHWIFFASVKHIRHTNYKIKSSCILHENYGDFPRKFLVIFFNFSELVIGYFLFHKGCHFLKLLKDFKADGFQKNALGFSKQTPLLLS
jgi:hypothetical protein